MRVLRAALKVLAVAVGAAFVLGAAGCVAIIMAAGRSPDGIPTLFGEKFVTIQGTAMQPAIRNGDLIGVRPLKQGEFAKEGDIITFNDKTKGLMTNRVMGLIKINDRPVWYVTKVDSSNSPNLGTVLLEAVVGRYEWRVPYAGFALRFVQRPVGLLTAVIMPAVLLLVLVVASAVRALRQAKVGRSEETASGEGGGGVSG